MDRLLVGFALLLLAMVVVAVMDHVGINYRRDPLDNAGALLESRLDLPARNSGGGNHSASR